MSFQIAGKLHKKFDTEQKTETFRAREFVIETDDQYPQMIKFQLTQDRCDMVEPYEVGTTLNVHFDLRGREWNDKYFTNLNAWKIEAETQPDAGHYQQDEDPGWTSQPPPAPPIGSSNDDDIPF